MGLACAKSPNGALSSPVGTAEFSRGRKPTESNANDRRSRVAATERVVRYVCRHYAAC
jgi:hypothetical protein